MKARIWLNGALALLVLGLALLAWFKPQPAPRAEFRLSALTAPQISRITIRKPGHDAIVLEKGPSGWRLTAPFSARAETRLAERLLDILAAASERRFPATDLDRFGLDAPLGELSLNRQTFAFGGQNPLTGEQYVATGGYVYLVPPGFFAGVLKAPSDFAARRLFTGNENPVGFDFPDLKLTRNDGRWAVSPPHPDWGPDRINRWADEWRLASSLVTQPADRSRGGEPLTIRLEDGRLIPMSIAQRAPEFVLVREDENLEYHFPRDVGKRLLDPGSLPE